LSPHTGDKCALTQASASTGYLSAVPASPQIAVVVPTRDRPEALRRCLRALRAQTAAIEIVVVDDGSAAASDVRDAAEESAARLLRREGEGPAAARNAGFRAVGAAVVCFTDDDCEPEPGWAQALAAPILSGVAAASGGVVLAAASSSAADRAWSVIVAHLQREAAAAGTASPGFAATANLGCSRALLEALPFDQTFPFAAGEDRDWGARAAARGSAPVHVPDAVVVHRPQLTSASFLRQQFRYGRGGARFRSAGPERGFGSPGFYARLLRAGFAAGPRVGALVLAAQGATAAGTLAERRGARRVT
jgi:glycosyltransferase involved in cell wall biosynthesis